MDYTCENVEYKTSDSLDTDRQTHNMYKLYVFNIFVLCQLTRKTQ